MKYMVIGIGDEVVVVIGVTVEGRKEEITEGKTAKKSVENVVKNAAAVLEELSVTETAQGQTKEIVPVQKVGCLKNSKVPELILVQFQILQQARNLFICHQQVYH